MGVKKEMTMHICLKQTLFYGFGKAVSMQVDRQVTDVYAWSTMTVISGQYVTKNNTKRIKHN